MAIEFHDTDPFQSVFLESIKLITEWYDVVHIHANNNAGVAADGLPEILEITFLSKPLSNTTLQRNRLPMPGLDFPNNPRKIDYELVFTAAT
jgi:hypothetical protein